MSLPLFSADRKWASNLPFSQERKVPQFPLSFCGFIAESLINHENHKMTRSFPQSQEAFSLSLLAARTSRRRRDKVNGDLIQFPS